jgi:hypothetical protein
MWVRNHLVNPVVRALGHSRAHRLLGERLVLLSYTGHRTGRRFEVPVMAAPAGEDLVVVAAGADGKTWWRNSGAEPTEVVVCAGGRRQRRTARRLVPGDPGHAEALAAHRHTFTRGHVPRQSIAVVLSPLGAT